MIRLRDAVVLEAREVDQRDRHLLGGLERVLHVAAVVEPDHALAVRRGAAAGDEVGGRPLLALPLLHEAGQVPGVSAPWPLGTRRSVGCTGRRARLPGDAT
jgi:hypothetical protein